MNLELHRSTAVLAVSLFTGICGQTHAQTPGEAAFQRLDKNKDGRITRDEAPSADGFAAADSDKDGSVTAEEFRRYLVTRQRSQAPGVTPKPAKVNTATIPPPVDGVPVLKTLPDADAVRDAAGTVQLFECVHVPVLRTFAKVSTDSLSRT